MIPFTQYYILLGIPYSANFDDVKKAYRKKAIELHPDHNNSPTAASDFQRLQEAYHFISENYNDIQLILSHQHNSRNYGYSHSQQKSDFTFQNINSRKKKKNVTDSRLGRNLYVSFHIFFIITGLGMIVLPLSGILFYHMEDDYASGSAILTLIGVMIIGFSMIWKLGQGLQRYFLFMKAKKRNARN